MKDQDQDKFVELHTLQKLPNLQLLLIQTLNKVFCVIEWRAGVTSLPCGFPQYLWKGRDLPKPSHTAKFGLLIKTSLTKMVLTQMLLLSNLTVGAIS